MLSFRLAKRFDVITCLFSAIGFMKTSDQLRRAIRNMSLHLTPGGVLIVEPWITPSKFKRGTLQVVLVKRPGLRVVRVGRSFIRGRLSILDFHYLVATARTVRYFREAEKFGLFTHSGYLTSFRNAGLRVIHYEKGLMGRGLYVGVKASSGRS
jgi:SAM-dependent methyltransferase